MYGLAVILSVATLNICQILMRYLFFSLKGESVYQYEGDRTRDDIVNFALRLVGPSVNQIESKEDFEDAKSKVETVQEFL